MESAWKERQEYCRTCEVFCAAEALAVLDEGRPLPSPVIAYSHKCWSKLQVRVLGPSSCHSTSKLALPPQARADRTVTDKITYTNTRDPPRIVQLPAMTWISKTITTFGLVLVAHA